jgi:hypothetical protein
MNLDTRVYSKAPRGSVITEHEENVRQQILDGLIADGACFRQPQNLRVKRRGDLMFHNGHFRDFPSLSLFIRPISPKYQ